MTGSLRFILATFVVLSHLGHLGIGNFGISSVVVFYMLCGFVVAKLMAEKFSGRPLAFYAERFFRIYPVYIFFLLLTALFLFATDFRFPTLSFFKTVTHITIIPLNYCMFVDVPPDEKNYILPVARSLGAEVQAYVLLPLVVFQKKIKWLFGGVSLMIFSAAMAGKMSSAIDWGYHLFPGVFFIFLTGSALYRSLKTKDCDSFDRFFPKICWAWVLVLFVGLGVKGGFSKEMQSVVMGFLLGIPILAFVTTTAARIPHDNFLGQISYGLFIVHISVIWLFEYLFDKFPEGVGGFLFVMAISVLLSVFAVATIEKSVWPVRKKLSDLAQC